jgi:hypothetical protein
MSVLIPRVFLGFGSTWLTEPDDITWTEVTGEVMDRRQPVTMLRGSSAIHGEPDTGQLNLTLRNSSRDFDPLHATGPYFGQLVSGVPIKIEAALTESLSWGDDELLWDTVPLVWSGFSGPIWTGTVKGWPQRYDRGNTTATVPVSAFDTFDKLSRAKIPRSPLVAELLADSPHGLWPLDETTGDVMRDLSGNQRDGTYQTGTTALSTDITTDAGAEFRGIAADGEHIAKVPVASASLTPAFGALVDLSDIFEDVTNGDMLVLVELGKPSPSSLGFPVQWGVEIVSTTAKTARLFIRSDGLPGFGYSTTFTASQPRYIATIIDLLGGGNPIHFVDGVEATGSSSPSNLTGVVAKLRLLGPKSVGSKFRGAVSHLVWNTGTVMTAARIAAYAEAALAPLDEQSTGERIEWILDDLGWPAGLRDIEPGETELGPVSFMPGDGALEYLRQCARTEDGTLFLGPDGVLRLHDRYWRHQATEATVSQVELTDDGTGVGVATFEWDPQDDELLVNVARLTRRGGTQQVVVDEASRDLYGEAELSLGDLLHRDDTQTRSQAEWVVLTRSTPTDLVRKALVRVHKLGASAQSTLLGLDLGHRVTCTRHPQGVGDPFTIECIVDGIHHEVTSSEWLLELYLSPAPDATVTLFTLDTSELDGVDVLAY